MSQPCFHSSIEGAQHGAKSLDEFLTFAKASGASGAQPSNFLVQDKDGGIASAQSIRDCFEKHGLTLDGISAHCPFWVHTTAWTGSPSVKPFIPESLHDKSANNIEAWSENYLFQLMDLAAELNIKIMPMFWGVAFGWEIASGYPWGFWSGPQYDLIKEGFDRFAEKTAKLRQKANELDIRLAHEIHPGTGAMTGDDFMALVDHCDGDACLTVNADPSHCWEGESWEDRFLKVGERVVAAHVKNFVIRPGLPLRSMAPDWPKRAMQFVDLGSGDLNMTRYIELLIHIGYPQRYRSLMGTQTAPLVVEAESAYRDLDACSADGIAFTRDNLCFPIASGSFEDGMGA
ncbi:MAG: TIM barrel protein [Verrucomicrobiota bacterium]